MSFEKVSFEESLASSVVGTGRCLGCGACVVVCPFKCLEYVEGKPTIVKECKACGICPQACPVYDWSWPEIEEFVFGRPRRVEEEFGIYRQLSKARATDEGTRKFCQDGGVVTALLSFALENQLIDGAVVSGRSGEKPLQPVPKLVSTPEEVLECAGTRYCYSPNLLALREAVEKKKTNLAFVGTPCQIRAIRKMKIVGLKRFAKRVKFLVGLMCSECFTYEGLMNKGIREALGVNLKDVTKMNIKGRILVSTKSEVKEISLKEAKQYARESCRFCDDFSSELADISTGGLGLDKWTFTIVRSGKGEELFESAESAGIIKTENVEEDSFALRLLQKLSKKKRRSS